MAQQTDADDSTDLEELMTPTPPEDHPWAAVEEQVETASHEVYDATEGSEGED